MRIERSNRREESVSSRSVTRAELERRRRPSNETASRSAQRMHQTAGQSAECREEADKRQAGIGSDVLNRAAAARAAAERTAASLAAERPHQTIRRHGPLPDEDDVNLFESLLTGKPDEETEDTTEAETSADTGMTSAGLPDSLRFSVFSRAPSSLSGHSKMSHGRPTSRNPALPADSGLQASSSAAFQSLTDTASERKAFSLHVQTRDIGGIQLQAKPQSGGWHVQLKPDDPANYMWLTQSRAAIERGLSRDLKSVITLELLE